MRFADLADKGLDAAVCHIDTTKVQSVARAADSQKISISVSTWDTTQGGQFDDLVLETVEVDLSDLTAVRIGNKDIIFHHTSISGHRELIGLGCRTRLGKTVHYGKRAYASPILPDHQPLMTFTDPLAYGASLLVPGKFVKPSACGV